MFADCKFFAIFATLVLVWIPLVRGDDLKCYDSGKWKPLGSQKEVSCPNGTCIGTWTAEPGKDEKTGILLCKPHVDIRRINNWQNLVEAEYRNKYRSIDTITDTFFQTLSKTSDEISAAGSSIFFPFPGINGNAKATGYIKDIMICQLIDCYAPGAEKYGKFSEERQVRLKINANVGANEFQVKLDQKVQFGRDSQRGDIKINKKKFEVEIVCIGQPQVCTRRRSSRRDLEAFERAALKEFGSNKEVTLTWGKEINFRITGNFKPIVEKYLKVKKAISENRRTEKALKNAIEKIIGDITLVAKANVEIDDSTSAEVNLNGNSNKVLNQIFGNPRTRQEPEYAYKICMEKKCIHAGACTKNLCNHPED